MEEKEWGGKKNKRKRCSYRRHQERKDNEQKERLERQREMVKDSRRKEK